MESQGCRIYKEKPARRVMMSVPFLGTGLQYTTDWLQTYLTSHPMKEPQCYPSGATIEDTLWLTPMLQPVTLTRKTQKLQTQRLQTGITLSKP